MSALAALVLLFSPLSQVAANNLTISSVTQVNLSTWTVDVQFDISWENSWRDTGAPTDTANWDAAWVFVKFSTSADGVTFSPWGHASLHSSGHTVPSGAQMDLGTTSAVNVGAFLYRSAAGSGTNNWTGAALRWNYEADGVSPGVYANVRVFGIEMVRVSSGSFYVGSGGSETNAFYQYPTTTNAFLISSEGAINMGATNDYLWAAGAIGTATLPEAFPKGFNAFYLMKSEISQRQYVDFLNTLTRAQQNTRTGSNVTGDTITNTFVMSNTTVLSYRNGIRAPASGNGTTAPIVFGMDFNSNGVFNEVGDGGWIACNYLSWADVAAYGDWAGLRPFTELELEKAARGGQTPVVNEYAWGTALSTQATGISNAGTATEGPSNAEANAVVGNLGAPVQGPLRSGAMARSATSRAEAGAGYSGALDLSGGLWKRSVTVGNSTGRNFTGSHGDGKLNASGDADVSLWPGTSATGSGFRGGAWQNDATNARVSDRLHVATTNANRDFSYGGRLARASP